MNARFLRVMIFALVAIVLSASGAMAQSAQVIVTPKAAYRITYDNNVNNTKDGDIEHVLTPALQVDVNTERSRNTFEASVSLHKYHDLDQLDRTTQEYSLSSKNELHERVRLNLDASYEDDYTIGKISEELATTARKTARRRLSLSPRLEFVADERNLIGLNYSYGTTDYDRADYVDYENQGASVDWTYIWTERFRLRSSVGMNWYDTSYDDGDGSYTNLTAMVGFDYDIDEIWTLSFMGGLLQSKSVVDRPGLDIEKDGEGYVGTARLAWDYPRSDGYVEYARDDTVGLSGQTLTRDRFRIYERYLLTERMRLSMTALATLSESDETIARTDSSYYQLRSNLEYDLDEHWTWEVGCGYEFTEDNVNSTDYDRSKVWMGIRWKLPEEL